MRNQVTAVLVTRGDQDAMLERILDSLIFDKVVVWNNSEREDKKTAGRYYATLEAETSRVYFQDDDVIVPHSTQVALLMAARPGVMVANWAHGDDPDGYDDIPLVGGGAIVERQLPWQALNRYLDHWPEDDAFYYEADFIAGALYRAVKQIHFPFKINTEVAQHPSRLCNQPFQKDLKREITGRARSIRHMIGEV